LEEIADAFHPPAVYNIWFQSTSKHVSETWDSINYLDYDMWLTQKDIDDGVLDKIKMIAEASHLLDM